MVIKMGNIIYKIDEDSEEPSLSGTGLASQVIATMGVSHGEVYIAVERVLQAYFRLSFSSLSQEKGLDL